MREGAICAGMKLAEMLTPTQHLRRRTRKIPHAKTTAQPRRSLQPCRWSQARQTSDHGLDGLTYNQFKRHADQVAGTTTRCGACGC